MKNEENKGNIQLFECFFLNAMKNEDNVGNDAIF
jgi:hypothetical protein